MDAYWQQQMDPWQGAGRSLGQAMMGMPYLQMQARNRAAMQNFYNARAQEQSAAAEDMQQRTRIAQQQADQGAADQAIDAQLSGAMRKVALNPNDTDAQADVIAAFSHSYRKDPEQTSKALGNLFAQFQARSGSTNWNQMAVEQGAAGNVADTQARIAAEQAKPITVGPGAVVYDPQGRQVVYQNPSAAAEQQQFETTTTKQDAVAGTPAMPAVHHWGLFGGTTDPAQPAIPGVPEKTTTRRTLIAPPGAEAATGGQLAAALQQPQAQTQPAAPAAAQPAPTPALPAGSNPDDIISQAKDAIYRGADPQKVSARLAAMGLQLPSN